MRKNIVSDDVKDFILEYIKDQKMLPGQRLPSLRAIASESGASMPTVQRAVAMLVNEGRLISKIGSGTFVAEKNDLNSKLIGIAVPHIDNQVGNFVSDAVISIKESLQAAGYCPVVLEPPSGIWGKERDEEELKLIKRFIDLGVCGMVVDSSVSIDSPVWKRLKQLSIPVVCFNNCDNSFELNFVAADNYVGGAIAAEHFIEKGHKKLAIVASNFSDSFSVVERVRGFTETLKKHGIEIEKNKLITIKSNSKDDLIQKYESLTKQLGDISGIFAVNDTLAIEMMTAYRNMGYLIPDQISFIGFDDSSLCEHLNPRLSSVNQLSSRMGARAAKILLEQLNNPDEYQEKTQVRLAPKLTIRDSVMNLNA
jgi:GntR family transcriptional regulator, arabinose operon transcriptional repressor